jgi:hypothetical protein
MPKLIRPLLTEPGPPDPEYRAEPRWAMLSHVEYNLWRVFEWAVSEHGDLSTCPFEPLLRLHMAGWYPVGFQGEQLVVFGRRGTDIAQAAAEQAHAVDGPKGRGVSVRPQRASTGLWNQRLCGRTMSPQLMRMSLGGSSMIP